MNTEKKINRRDVRFVTDTNIAWGMLGAFRGGPPPCRVYKCPHPAVFREHDRTPGIDEVTYFCGTHSSPRIEYQLKERLRRTFATGDLKALSEWELQHLVGRVNKELSRRGGDWLVARKANLIDELTEAISKADYAAAEIISRDLKGLS